MKLKDDNIMLGLLWHIVGPYILPWVSVNGFYAPIYASQKRWTVTKFKYK